MIVAHRLSRKFGNFVAVDSAEFRIPRGEVAGFLGPNGAGKTTTIRMISGSLAPTGGTVTVDGLDVRRQAMAVRRRIGYLPETAPLYGEMRVTELLRYRGRLFGVPARQRAAAIDRVLDRCGLESVRRRPIHQLSRGYRQRVGLAAALLHDPPVLILDEPTAGLDPAQILDVRALIRDLAGDHTILLSTHILPEVEVTCDRVIMIAGGRIHADASLAELQRGGGRGASYRVEIAAPLAAEVIEAVAGVESVARTRLPDGWWRLEVTARSGAPDLREELAGRLAVHGGTVRELHREDLSLEQLFLQMIGGAAAGATAMADEDDAEARAERPAAELRA